MTIFIRNSAFAAIFTFSMFGFSQTREVDSLINKINNNDGYVMFVNTMSPRLKTGAATEIVKIGKQATPKLIDVLDNESKSVIAHFILLQIWKENWEEQKCCDVRELNGVEIYYINGLEVRYDGVKLYATADSAKKNKSYWTKFWNA